MDNNLEKTEEEKRIIQERLLENEKYKKVIERMYNQEKEDIDRAIETLKKYIPKDWFLSKKVISYF